MTLAPIHLMEQTISVLRRYLATTTDGSSNAAWHTHLASIKAYVEPTSQNAKLNEDRPTMRRRYKIFVDCTHDIQRTDRLHYQGISLRIIDLLGNNSGSSTLQIMAEEEPV